MAQKAPEHTQQGAEGKPSSAIDTPDCDLEIFLIGKTGHGKSATGNSILGWEKFDTSDMGDSATQETDVGWVERDGLTIKVVDGPGLMDTRLAGEKQLEQMEVNLSKGFLHSPNGFHAMVLVLSYGQRFTAEEEKTVKLLKGILGDDFIKKHCILVVTHGENFLYKNSNRNFTDWCGEQKGALRELMDECCDRVVLFYNQTPERQEESNSRLVTIARGLGDRYTSNLFDQIAEKRSSFIQKQGAIQLKELIQAKINMIIGHLKKGEYGDRLVRLVDKLEKEINKEKGDKQTVHDVKQGIQEMRQKMYSKAQKTFMMIEQLGKKLLTQLLTRIQSILQKYLIPLANYLREHLF